MPFDGYKQTAEHRKKISDSMKNRTYKPRTPEHQAKLNAANKATTKKRQTISNEVRFAQIEAEAAARREIMRAKLDIMLKEQEGYEARMADQLYQSQVRGRANQKARAKALNDPAE